MSAASLATLGPPLSFRPSNLRSHDSWFSILLLAIAFLFVWLCRFVGPASIQPWVQPLPFQSSLDLFLLLAALIVAIVLHEAGHLIASLLLGFHIFGGTFGPLQLQTLPGTSKFTWSSGSFLSASVSAVPRSMNCWRQAMLIVVAAGPIATLATCVLVTRITATGHVFTFLQIAFVQVSTLLFTLGLFPNSRYARQQNDARLFVDLLRKNDGATEMELKVLLKQQMLAGTRPQDFSMALLQRLANFRGRQESQLLFAQAMLQWAIDSDYFELADAWDAHAIALSKECHPRARNSALASSACFDVIFRSDLESARSKFAEVDFASLFPTCFEHRARAAQQIALGRLYRAPAHILRAQYSLPKGIEYYMFERLLLEKLHMRVLRADKPSVAAATA